MATPPRVRTRLARGDAFKKLLGYKRRSVYEVSYRARMSNSNARGTRVVAHFELLMTSSLVDGVILSVAVLQAERGISRYDTVCNGRSLGPLVKARALRDDVL